MIRPEAMKLFRTMNDLFLAGWSSVVVMRMAGHDYNSLRAYLNLDEHNFLDQMKKHYIYHRKRTKLTERMPDFLQMEKDDLH